MPLKIASSDTKPDFSRHKPVVCIPLYGAHKHFTACIRSLLANTSVDTPIVIADDAGPEPASQQFLTELDSNGKLRHTVYWLRQETNLGFVKNVNEAFGFTSPGDMVILNSDCEVAEGWLDGLFEAAYSDSLIATATALTNNGTLVSVPYRNIPHPNFPQDASFKHAAAQLRATSPKLRPYLSTAIGHCVYIKRSALELVGSFDESFSPAYGEEVDFSQRCRAAGLQHVVADDVLVKHAGGGSFNLNGDKNPIQKQHDAINVERYPYYEAELQQVEVDSTSRLANTLSFANQVVSGLSVTIGGRCLGPWLTGTQIYVLELVAALARRDDIDVRVITPKHIGEYAESAMKAAGAELLPVNEIDFRTLPTRIFHRPFQVTSYEETKFFSCGERIVVTHHDLIAYRNPGYFASFELWNRFQRLTQQALGRADLVIFDSHHAAQDALNEDLVEQDQLRIVHAGIDHSLAALVADERAPANSEQFNDKPYLFYIGTDYEHKNRVFGLKLLKELKQQHNWDGRIVFAGPRVIEGGSNGPEAEWLAHNQEFEDSVVFLPAVSEAEKGWLYRNCAAVIYPTTYEGFGLVPFEAAQADAPCIWGPQASLEDWLPAENTLIVPWSESETANRVLPILTDPTAHRKQTDSVKKAAARLTWDLAAEQLIDGYQYSLSRGSTRTARLGQQLLDMEVHRDQWEERYWHLRHRVGPTGMALVDSEKGLPDPAQRTLAGLLGRSATRKPLLVGLQTARFAINPKAGFKNIAARRAARTSSVERTAQDSISDEIDRVTERLKTIEKRLDVAPPK